MMATTDGRLLLAKGGGTTTVSNRPEPNITTGTVVTIAAAGPARRVMTAGLRATEPRTGVCPACCGKKYSHAGEMGQSRRSTRTRCIVCRGTGYIRVGNTKR